MISRWLPQMLIGVTFCVAARTVTSAPTQRIHFVNPRYGYSTTGILSNRGDDPLPREKTNCVRCHATAGRELTVPVLDFAQSVHDRAKLSCNDCHGGNTENDAMAHEQEFGFIGTKLSAHMAACSECHAEEAATFRKSPHYWDLTRRINREYPVCIDCHGNHDVGKPPAEFALANVCSDCHKDLEAEYPAVAKIVADSDRLWKTLRIVRTKGANQPVPGQLQSEWAKVRRAFGRAMHLPGNVTKAQADALNARVDRLNDGLKRWLLELGGPQ